MTIASSPTPTLAALAESSARAIVASQHASGAFPASLTFSAYQGYCWFRDGSFIADAASAWGAVEEAERFFDWCGRILEARAPTIGRIVSAAERGSPLPDTEMLATRFTFDGREGDDEWWDFQLDGYGTWLWALMAHCRRHGRDSSRWHEAVRLTVDYLVSSWHRPCYDWWEEHSEQIHVSTLGCVIAGLEAAADTGVLDDRRHTAVREAAGAARRMLRERGTVAGHLVKWLDADTVDGSLSALVAPLGVVAPEDALASSTVAAVDRGLNVDGGVHRFLADTFYGGGQWPLLSCFLGLAALAVGDRGAARRQLEWAAGTASARLELPEQVTGHLLAPDRRQEWVERWGPAASPLLWSHAMYLRLALELDIVTPGRTDR